MLYGLGGPFSAGWSSGSACVASTIGALLGVSAGSSLTVLMTAPWQLDILWGIVNGLATGAIAIPLAAIIANRWFVERRGLVTGVLTASSATGQLIFLPVLAAIVTHWGWRYASVTVSVVALGVVLPLVALFMRDRPAEIGLMPFGATEPDPPPAAAGNPFASAIDGLRMARTSSAFWLLAGSFFICGLSTNGLIGTHLIPAAMDHGLGEVAAASLLATIGVFDIVGTTCSGWLTDRYDPRLLLFWYYAPARAEPARPAVRVRLSALRADPLRRLLRSRLDRDGPADRGADRRDLRARARRGRVRLDLLLAHVRRGARGLGRRRDPHLVRRLRLGVRQRRPALPVRLWARRADRTHATPRRRPRAT